MPFLNRRVLAKTYTTKSSAAMKAILVCGLQMCVLFALAQAASSHSANSQQSAFVQSFPASTQRSHGVRASSLQRFPLTLRTAKPISAVASVSMSEDTSFFARREMMKRVLLAISGSQLLSTSASAQPAAGLDVNKGGGGFEKVDPSQLPKNKPKSKKRAAGMAIFEDERLGYAFAVPPNFKGQSSSVGNGGQIIAFFDEDTGDVNTRITLVAQPAPVESLDELKKAFVPNGEVGKQEMQMKSVGKEDGAVYIVETAQKDKPTMITLFALRKQPAPVGNWLISLTTQASSEVFGKYEKEFRSVLKSFRLIYPDIDVRDVLDEELGKSVGETELSDEVNAVPFGGK